MTRATVVLALSMLLCGVRAARAQSASDLLGRGVQAYQGLEYDLAAALLGQSLERDPAAGLADSLRAMSVDTSARCRPVRRHSSDGAHHMHGLPSTHPPSAGSSWTRQTMCLSVPIMPQWRGGGILGMSRPCEASSWEAVVTACRSA